MINRDKLIAAYMKEYNLPQDVAEKRADQTIAKLEEMYKQKQDNSNTEGEEDSEEEFEEWVVSEVICVKCLERWIAVRPSDVLLKKLQCPRCSYIGAAIETGEEFYAEEWDEENSEE